MFQKMGDYQRVLEKNRDDNINTRQKSRQYKEKLRQANIAIKTLSTKIATYELERYGGSGGDNGDDIRVGGGRIQEGRETHQSNKGSEYDIKDAISKIIQDEKN